jgi:C4-dicarboxylate-specific signal transduction histidine kinase
VAEVKSFDLRRDGITLRVDVPETLPLVRGAAFQLEQVVLNLVVNAQDELRGRPGRREIAILGTAENGHAVLEVHDSGPGIAPAALNRLFEPFYTTKPGGAGLGLAISAGIVEAFGGKLTADNRRRTGAIFRLELPAAPLEDSSVI